MADKFPELDTQGFPDELDHEGDAGADFLEREKELVGSEFQTPNDQEGLESEDDEFSEFKDQYPEVGEDDGDAAAATREESPSEDYEGFGNGDADNGEGESKHIQEWRERRDLEIAEREKANAKKKKDIVAKAQQTIDDFYDNYNSKKEKHSKEVAKEQDEFLEKRDGFLKRGTLWDRVNELVTEVGETSGGDRDKSRFKALLTKLQGDEKVPGAGGYQ
ncbi:Clathrin light chain [[Candida] zeylanoides]